METKHAQAPTIPLGMVEVSQDEFFAMLKADRRDIMPSNLGTFHTTWETPDRAVWGWTTPGWKNPEQTAFYAVARSTKAQ